MKRKNIATIISLILVATLLCGCGNSESLLVRILQQMAGESETTTEAVKPGDDAATDTQTVAASTESVDSNAAEDTEQTDEKESDAEKPDYEALYAPVLDETLEKIYDRLESDDPVRYVPSGIVEMIMYEPTESLLDEVCYVIEDVSGDGIPELLMGYDSESEEQETSYIMGVYTLKNDEPYCTIDGMARSSFRWMGNGYFYYIGSGGAAYTYIGKCRLSEDGAEIIWDDYYFTDPTEDGMDVEYYHNTTGSDDTDESEVFDGDFWSVTDKLMYRCKTIAWSPMRSYEAKTGGSTAGSSAGGRFGGAFNGTIQSAEIPEAGSGTISIDITGNGKPDEIPYTETADQYDCARSFELEIDDKTYSLDKGVYWFASYGITLYWITDASANGSEYLWIRYTTDGDHQDTGMYCFTGDKFEYLGMMDGVPLFGKYGEHHQFISDTPEDPDDFLVQTLDYKLGTLSLTSRCRVGDDGCPEQKDDYMYYQTGTKAFITAAKEIPCKFHADEYTDQEKAVTIEEGAGVIPYGTDGQTFIDLCVEGSDGLYRIYIGRDDISSWYLTYKDGLVGSDLLTDCFDGLVFAG